MKMVKIVILLLIIAGGFFYHSRKSRSADLKIKEGTKVANIVLNAKIKTSKGDINLKLIPEAAPMTVTNFVYLAKRGYYDGLIFHRVIADFMIQGETQQEQEQVDLDTNLEMNLLKSLHLMYQEN